MSCHHAPGGLQDLLDEVWGKTPGAAKPAEEIAPSTAGSTEPLTGYQLMKKIEKTIDEYVRPILKNDGGDVEIVDVKDTTLYCRLLGVCSGCPGANTTLKLMIERTLKDQVDERIRVIAV